MSYPDAIGAGRAPGGLVACTYGADGRLIDEAALTNLDDADVVGVRHAGDASAATAVIYDGDSGRLVAVLTVPTNGG